MSLVQEAVHEAAIPVVESTDQKLLSNIEDEIESLIDSGLRPNDIVIISVRGKGEEKNIMHREKIGGRRIVPATDVDAESEIICDTFLRFKGLQRPAVIVTVRIPTLSARRQCMHMAISRTQSLLRIVGRESEIRNDPILEKFI